MDMRLFYLIPSAFIWMQIPSAHVWIASFLDPARDISNIEYSSILLIPSAVLKISAAICILFGLIWNYHLTWKFNWTLLLTWLFWLLLQLLFIKISQLILLLETWNFHFLYWRCPWLGQEINQSIHMRKVSASIHMRKVSADITSYPLWHF